MEFRTLQNFLVIAEEGNISHAAEVLNITQPSLSRQIAQLEDELGVQLFIRGRHLTLTEAGVMLRQRAEEVVSMMKKIDSEFQKQSEIGGVIAIGSGGFSPLRNFPSLLSDFRALYPNISYQIHTNSAEFIKERLDNGLLDFAFLLEPVDISRFDYIRLPDKVRWGLLLPSDHKLAEKESITKDDLRNLQLITSERLSIQKELELWLGTELASLDILATYNLINSAVGLVKEKKAVALTVEGSAETSDLVFRPLYPELSMTSVFAWKRLHADRGAAGRFLEYIKTNVKYT